MILPTDSYMNKLATGYANPIEAFFKNYFDRKTEVDKLRQTGDLMNQSVEQYNSMNKDESDYQQYLKQNPQQLPIDTANLSPQQQALMNVVKSITGVIGAKKAYPNDPNAGNTANQHRGALTAMGIDPKKYGLGADNTLEQSESMGGQYSNSIMAQIQDAIKRQAFAALNPQMRSGIPFNVNGPQQQRPVSPWMQYNGQR